MRDDNTLKRGGLPFPGTPSVDKFQKMSRGKMSCVPSGTESSAVDISSKIKLFVVIVVVIRAASLRRRWNVTCEHPLKSLDSLFFLENVSENTFSVTPCFSVSCRNFHTVFFASTIYYAIDFQVGNDFFEKVDGFFIDMIFQKKRTSRIIKITII